MSDTVTYLFRSGRYRVFSLAAILALVGLTSCSEENGQDEIKNDKDYPGIETEGLTELDGECSFTAPTMAVTLNDGAIVLIQKGSDGTLTVNGYACGTGTAPTATTATKINITGAGTGNTVILDYSNGYFGLGATSTSSLKGTYVNFVESGTSYLKLKGLSSTSAGDVITMGKNATSSYYGISLGSAHTYADINVTNVTSFVVSMGPGADTFTSTGSTMVSTSGGTTYASGVNLPIVIYGGDGNDTFNEGDNDHAAIPTAPVDPEVDPEIVGETLYGGAGSDTVDYSSRSTAVTVTVNANTTTPFDDGIDGENDNIIDIDIIKGGTADDILTQDPAATAATTVYGSAGSDTITGGLGNDILYGGAGNDVFYATGVTTTDGNDQYRGEAGIDTVSYASRTVAVTVVMDGSTSSGSTSLSEADKVYTDVENLVGGSGNDTITGNTLNNTLYGGPGNDTLNGGAGDDMFVDYIVDVSETSTTSGNDTFNGGAGTDTVSYADPVTRVGRAEDLVVAINNTANSGDADGETDKLACDIENIIGGDGDDTLTGHTTGCTVSATQTRDNTISGGVGADTINGGDGDDILDGEDGTDDVIACGDGIDICLDPDDCDTATDCEM